MIILSYSYITCPYCNTFFAHSEKPSEPHGATLVTCVNCKRMFAFQTSNANEVILPKSVSSDILDINSEVPHTAPVSDPPVVEYIQDISES